MIQDTTPYQSYASLMGGGPGALQNGGVGVGAATGGMAQILQDTAAQNQGLNVTAQDTANQQAQEALKQAQLLTSVQQAEAPLKIQQATQGLNVGAQYGESGLTAKALADQAENRQKMTVADRATHDSQNRDAVDASNLVDSKDFDWKNPEHVKMLSYELSKSGMKDVPQDLNESHVPQIHALAEMATKSLEFNRQAELAAASARYTSGHIAEKGALDVQVALAQSDGRFYQKLFDMAPAQRVYTSLQIQIPQQKDQNGVTYATPGQEQKFETQARTAMAASGQLKVVEEQAGQVREEVTQGTEKSITALAQRYGVSIDPKRSVNEQRITIANQVFKAAQEQMTKDYTHKQFLSTFGITDGQIKNLPEAPLSKPSDQNPGPTVAGQVTSPLTAATPPAVASIPQTATSGPIGNGMIPPPPAGGYTPDQESGIQRVMSANKVSREQAIAALKAAKKL